MSSKSRRELRLGQAEDPAVGEHVLPAGELGVEADADADERGDVALDPEGARRSAPTRPTSSRSSVVFPDPLRPMTPIVSPAGTSRSMSRSAQSSRAERRPVTALAMRSTKRPSSSVMRYRLPTPESVMAATGQSRSTAVRSCRR